MPRRARSLLALAAVIVVVGLAFAAAGCGGDSDETAAPLETTTAATTDTETGADTTAGTTTSDDDDTTTAEDDDTGIEDDTGDYDDGTTAFEDDRGGPATTSRGQTTSSRSGSRKERTIVAPVQTTLFRTSGNTIICGLKGSALLCWRPASGFTIRLPRAGRPTQDFIDANRGIPRRVRSIPQLRKGRAVRRGGFRCTLVGKGEVRCTNAARHGFQLGKLLSYRF